MTDIEDVSVERMHLFVFVELITGFPVKLMHFSLGSLRSGLESIKNKPLLGFL